MKPIIELKHIEKSFGAVRVIDDMSFAVYPGQVQALLGENGAGKSTLIKMMAGIYQPDAGEILIDGRAVKIPNAKTAEHYGIATIHQELNLVPSMSVAENIMLGRIPSRCWLVDRKEMRARAREALGIIGLNADLDEQVGNLGIARQQLVEIAKALSMKARILILDEPTAALTSKEIEQLFAVVDDLKSQGVGMVFISHHLDEIERIADSVCVLRDGNFIAEVPPTTSENELVRLMVGRSIDDQFPRQCPELGDVVLKVANLSSAGKFDDVSFEVKSGEVLGIAGLVGSGRTELLRAIAGADSVTAGRILVRGVEVKPGKLKKSIAAGIGMVPEDRKAQALVLGASVADNIGLATLQSTARMGIADVRGQASRAQEVSDTLRVRMADMSQPIRQLSGGNQQKAVFARWVLADSTILLLDEPTRGVDVGAKVDIYSIINEITASGGAVIMVSSELPEILGMSDRILVMSNGKVAGTMPASEASQDSIMQLAVSKMEEVLA